MFFNVFPFLIICCHIAKSVAIDAQHLSVAVANLKDAEGISNANEPPSAPPMSTEPVDAGHQVTHGWCFALQTERRLSPRWRFKLFKIHHHRAMQLLA